MKRLSHEALALLAQIQQAPRDSPIPHVLRELALLYEAAAIPHLAALLFRGNAARRTEAAAVIRGLIADLRPADFADLDDRMRLCLGLHEDFRHIDAGELAQLVGPGLAGTLVIELSTMHPNGYVREEAVKRLHLVRDGSEVPYLLLRLNDWVPSVRQAALAAVISRQDPNYISHFVDNLALLLRLESARRADHRECLRSIYALLRTPDARSSLANGLKDGEKDVRRACLRLLLTSESAELGEVLDLARSSNDAVLRLQALEHLTAAGTGSAVRAQLLKALSDRFFGIRREALRQLVTRFPEDALHWLMESLFDPAAAVRATARFELVRAGRTDVADHYRKALPRASGQRLCAILAGLAEIGTSSDLTLIEPFLSHARPSVRAIAVRGIGKLASEDCVDTLFPMVSDNSPRVVKHVRMALLPHVSAVDHAALFKLALHSEQAHVWTNAAALLSALDKWDALLYLIGLINRTRNQKAAFASNLVARIHPQFLKPTAAQIELIQPELRKLERKSALEREWADRLDFAVGLYAK